LSAFVVRAATPADAKAVAALYTEFAAYLRSLDGGDEYYFDERAYLRDGFGADPAFQGIVAEADGEIAGYLLWHLGYDSDLARRILRIADLFVRPASRRAGIGRALMDEAERVCRAHGGVELVWEVFEPNELARAFYRSVGARHVDDLLIMRRRIRG
jgi:ribosomal protein S18 acetylase RimI-like enzyme